MRSRGEGLGVDSRGLENLLRQINWVYRNRPTRIRLGAVRGTLLVPSWQRSGFIGSPFARDIGGAAGVIIVKIKGGRYECCCYLRIV